MDWLKDVIVDILVTVFIAAFIWFGYIWMWWVIAVYSGLLLVAKAVVLTGDGFLSRTQNNQQAPDWFLHVLYALNIIMLGMFGWWWLTGGWCLIWLFSYLGQRNKS
jgi:hypothetical protein